MTNQRRANPVISELSFHRKRTSRHHSDPPISPSSSSLPQLPTSTTSGVFVSQLAVSLTRSHSQCLQSLLSSSVGPLPAPPPSARPLPVASPAPPRSRRPVSTRVLSGIPSFTYAMRRYFFFLAVLLLGRKIMVELANAMGLIRFRSCSVSCLVLS